jgi:DNA repair exonuclease SbcCD nuclease subunit
VKALVVGDPHAVVEELDDCQRLIDCVCDSVVRHRPETVLFLGDLFHNHAQMRIEVKAFWVQAFQRIRALGPAVVVLVGNHDLPQSGASADQHALVGLDPELASVVSEPEELVAGVWMLPYMAKADFSAWLAAHQDVGGIICHQTFQGSRYENGFFAPDGVETAELPPKAWVISGHIHTPQTVGAVWYPGAPRWRSIMDAGVDRYIHMVEVAPYAYDRLADIRTDRWCRRLEVEAVYTEEDLARALERDPRGLRVNVSGDRAFVEKAEAALKQRGVKMRSSITRTATDGRVRESEGIAKAFGRYWETVQVPALVTKDALRQLVAQRLGL